MNLKLIELNPWWNTEKVQEEFLGIEREEYSGEINDKLKTQKILGIVGLRRSGKTTLIFQTINALLKNKISPKDIIYINIESFKYIEDKNILSALINEYEETFNKNIKTGSCFIFIDEIHQLDGWEYLLKDFYDLKYKSKFIISGSSFSLLYKHSSESLLGRIQFVYVSPLTFREFIKFKGMAVPLNKELKTSYAELSENKNKILNYLIEYSKVGGFPEYFKVNNNELWKKELFEEYISLLLYKDIVTLFKVRDQTALESLFRFAAKNSTQRFSYNKISNYLDVDKDTVKQDLYLLESALLIRVSNFYTKSSIIAERKEKKLYFCDTGLKNSIITNEDIGADIENVVFNNIFSLIKRESLLNNICYYTDKKKNELDMVIMKKDRIMPIEVKYRKDIGELEGLKSFMKKFKIKKGLVITKDLFELKEDIKYIPAWFFLLFQEDVFKLI